MKRREEAMSRRVFLAFDIGASNGRAVIGGLKEDGTLFQEEIYRFSNGFLRMSGGLYWDYVHIYRELLKALRKCRRRELEVACIGIDAWSQDYALLNKRGQVVGLPRCYREPKLELHADDIDGVLGDPKEFFRQCGQVKYRISSLRQLYYDCTRQPEVIESASRLLFIPYLFVYLLTGQAAYDGTLPAIGELGDTRTWGFRKETAELLGVPGFIPTLFESGTILGHTNRTILEETGYDKIPVACIDSHDTGSAVLAIGGEKSFLYVSSGTWSMYGAVVNEMRLNDRVYDARLCNSPMGDGRIALMAGTAGMFVIQQCMRKWKALGREITYQQLTDYARVHRTDSYFSFTDVSDATVDMETEVIRAVEKAGFEPPQDPFALYEVFANSLARLTVKELTEAEAAVGEHFDRIYLVGGGARAQAVNERIEEGSGKRVCTGLDEAAVAGNLLAQMVAAGELRDFKEARLVSRRTFFPTELS